MTGNSLLQQFIERLQDDEALELEFKLARGGLPASLWETVSAFANTRGGWILLGVDGRGRVEGLGNPQQRMKELHDLMRNEQKVSLPVCDHKDIEIQKLDGKEILAVRVRAVPRRSRPVFINGNPFTGTYVRRHEGDYRCRQDEVRRMIRESEDASAGSAALEHLTLGTLDLETLRRYRQRFQNAQPVHPWNDYDDARFLAAVGATDAGSTHPTVAGLLMFGRTESITSWRRRHLIDYRRYNTAEGTPTTWADRVAWEGNLLGAFDTIYPRLIDDQPTPFRVTGAARLDESAVHIALREALVNLLVHADYAEPDASLIQRSPSGFLFRNPGDSRVPEHDLVSADRSDPRNPELVRMFRLIGFAEEAGTGIARILHAWRELGLRVPQIDVGTERYEFSIQLSYVHLLSEEDLAWLNALSLPLTEQERLALCYARHEGRVDNLSLRRLTGEHSADTTKVLAGLRSRGLLDGYSGGRGSYYELASAVGEAGQLELDSVGSYRNTIGSASSTAGSEPSSVGRELREIALPAREKRRLDPAVLKETLVALCTVRPLSLRELADLLARNEQYLRSHLADLLKSGTLAYLYPASPRHPGQKYTVPG